MQKTWLIILGSLVLIGCQKEKGVEPFYFCETCKYPNGWNFKEDYSSKTPVALDYGQFNSGSSTILPDKVDLTSKFTPITNQGQLGTCVAFSLAYNIRSYLDAAVNTPETRTGLNLERNSKLTNNEEDKVYRDPDRKIHQGG